MRKNLLSVLLVIFLPATGGVTALLAQTPAPPAFKVGVVNQDKVLNDSEEGKRLKSDLEKLRSAKAAAIDAKEKEIKLLQDQVLSAQLSMSDEKRDELGRQLKRKRVEYERLNDDASAEFQEAANRAQGRLISLFRDMIAKYGVEKGYTVILEKGTLYFATDAVDITSEVLVRFNASTQAGLPAPPKG
ncbi:MAG TPA: OmpH family outer membrane protein [Candidatus Polarisedimenticolia bacterium]